MNFTIRSVMIAVATAAILFACLVSKSTILIEVATALTLFFIPMALVFALCDSKKRRRPFWIGFFVLSSSSLVFANYGEALYYGEIFNKTCEEMAHAIYGDPDFANVSQFNAVSSYMTIVMSVIIGMLGGISAFWIASPAIDQPSGDLESEIPKK